MIVNPIVCATAVLGGTCRSYIRCRKEVYDWHRPFPLQSPRQTVLAGLPAMNVGAYQQSERLRRRYIDSSLAWLFQIRNGSKLFRVVSGEFVSVDWNYAELFGITSGI